MGRNWEPQEDEALMRLVSIHGKQWGVIAAQMENRSASQVAARWEKCLDPKLTKGPFTQEEDLLIIDYVAKHGAQNWPALSQILFKRSPKQCRERWFNHLDPNVSLNSWTMEEDTIIFENHEKVGGKWALISKLLPGRTDNAIKNRWNSSISKRISVDAATGRRSILPDYSRRQKRSPKKDRPPPIHTVEQPEQKQQQPQQYPMGFPMYPQFPYPGMHMAMPMPLQKTIQPPPIQQIQQKPIQPPPPPQQQEVQVQGPVPAQSPLTVFAMQNGIFSPVSPFGPYTPSTPANLFTLGSSGAGTPFSPSQMDMNVFK